MPARNPAAVLARRVAVALEEFALAVELAEEPDEEDIVGDQDLTSRARGARQREILAVSGLRSEEGLRTGEVADAITYDEANTWNVLRSLEAQGLVETVPAAQPQRWRIAAVYRRSAAPYLEMAAHVRPGEWTTYGDIALAVRGTVAAARAVGRAAARLPHFPAPHRVLQLGGVIPAHWHDENGGGPEECRRRLEAEGVTFNADHADRNQLVEWHELQRRDEEEAH